MAKLPLRNVLLSLALAMLVLAILVAGSLFVVAPTKTHAAAPCTLWVQAVPTTVYSVSGKANVYTHLYKLTDQLGDDCGKFYAHVDVYAWAHQTFSIGAGVATIPINNGIIGMYHYNSIRAATSSSGAWFHVNSPVIQYNECAAGDGYIDMSSSSTYIGAITDTGCY